MELTRTMVLAVLQLTAVCVCQKFGVVHRRPVAGDKQIAGRQQQLYYNAVQSAVDNTYQPQQQQLSAIEQFYQQQQAGQPQPPLPYYPQQQKQLLEQQQQSRLQQQQLQLQQLQQLQLQQQLQQPSSSSAAAATAAAYYQPQQQQQQYDDFYLQQLQEQQLQLQQQQLQQQQSYYQQKPLFRPAIPVTETTAEDKPQTALSQQASPPQQTVQTPGQQSPPNLLGVLYSSATDVSKFQFSGNGVSYSF